MTPFIWKNDYQLGNPEVDQQHEQLFDLANQLVTSINQQALLNNILQLYRHIREHFKAEEAFMAVRDYADYQQHVDTHNLMLDKLVIQSDKIHKQEWRQEDAEKFMKEWLKHIMEEDAAIGDYLQAHQHDNPSGLA